MSWEENKLAGKEWFCSFIKKYNISYRTPETTSLAISTAFNRYTVNKFFDNLASVMDRYKFTPNRIFNVDEAGVTTVQSPKQVLAAKGTKQIGSITSRERGELVTLVCCISATGNSISPAFIFPRIKYKNHFVHDGLTGSIGTSNKLGWINEEIYSMYLKHIVNQISCNNENRALLILDNHESHVPMASIQLAKQNGLILLTIPPHISYRLQPLDRLVFGPLKSKYNQAMDEWMRSNPGKIVIVFNIPALINKAFLAAFTPSNIQAGFKSTGIYPFCRDIFDESAFAPSELTNHSYLNQEIIETNNAQTSCQNQEDNLFSTISTFNHQSNDISYVCPSEILSVSRAGPRKLTASGRKRGKTTILTDTPKKKQSQIHNILKKKTIKKALLNKKRKLFHENSSDEEIELNVQDLCDESSDYSEEVVHPV